MHEKAPDFRTAGGLALLPVDAVPGEPDCNLGGDSRAALALPCGRTMRFEFKVPGEHPVLRFHDGHVTAHPELSVRLVGAGGSQELDHHETSESAWTVRRVPLPVAAGARCTVELAALDGRGKAGLGTGFVSDGVLGSGGSGLDEGGATQPP